MNKKTFLFLCLIVLLSVTLAGCNWFKKEKTDLGEQEAVQQETVQEEIEDFSGSMQDLLARGQSVKCTYGGETDDGDKFSGTLYIADNKARQDAEGEENGEIIEIHTIIDDRWVYFWTSHDPSKGMKMHIDQTEQELKEFSEDVGEADQQEWQKDFSYKCSKWKADKSKFELPNGVSFMDMSEMMNQASKMFGEMDADLPDREMEEGDLPVQADELEGFDVDDLKESMCAMCDNAPDVEECRAGLGCD